LGGEKSTDRRYNNESLKINICHLEGNCEAIIDRYCSASDGNGVSGMLGGTWNI